ncbi:MAG: hypothetical protein A2289_02815 [Deltaproteobacteria bacterium RIFOXYA12_FULL_58_15]|nr:MAG: hypothetical protein A2289_02815 [Deltaproteobacteria bacterium RIFOXYA12_FULL_58_15]
MKNAPLPLAVCITLWVAGCSDDPSKQPTCDGKFFGLPSESTGLDADICAPECRCGDVSFVATIHLEEEINRLAATTLIAPPPTPDVDPYAASVLPIADTESVCTVVPDDNMPRAYRLETVRADTAGDGIITHFNACGLCSSLQDLSVYMRYPDLTTPVRACAMLSVTGPDEDSLACIADLGFTDPCAKIWFYNSRNTRYECLGPCLAALEDPYQFPDGSLNGCLACDEEKSGPVFKAVAGRTRRNTGLASAICRPCAEVGHLTHDYSAVVD